MLELSFVIVSWNVSRLLSDCIRSIVATSSNLTYEIIVVDNASSDDTVELLRRDFAWVRLVVNRENVGFARANNQGFELAMGKYIFILNPDTVIQKGAVERMKEYLDAHPQVGMVGPKLISSNGEIQSASARVFPTLGKSFYCNALRMHKLPIIGNYFYKKYLSPYSFDKTQSVDAISGAAMVVRKEILHNIKGFGEVFFHLGEDLDLCYRVKKNGWVICFLPYAVIIHLCGQSSKQASAQTIVKAYMSVEQYFLRCHSLLEARVYRLISRFIDAPISLIISYIKLLIGKITFEDWKLTVRTMIGLIHWKEKLH